LRQEEGHAVAGLDAQLPQAAGEARAAIEQLGEGDVAAVVAVMEENAIGPRGRPLVESVEHQLAVATELAFQHGFAHPVRSGEMAP
jgi:hypothetical protein